jgi:hypothetical protein
MYRSAVASADSGSASQLGARSSRIWPISRFSASLARQSASEKKSTNCRRIESASEPNSR